MHGYLFTINSYSERSSNLRNRSRCPTTTIRQYFEAEKILPCLSAFKHLFYYYIFSGTKRLASNTCKAWEGDI